MMKRRNPQLSLRLDATPLDVTPQWRAGTTLMYLGRRLTLASSTTHRDATIEGDQLYLPLPPQASSQQIRDRAESWLREQAQQYLAERIRILSQKRAAPACLPRLKLSFAARSPWAEVEGSDCLRCNWRLIEQDAPIIDQALIHALHSLPSQEKELDLFGFAFSARPPGAA